MAKADVKMPDEFLSRISRLGAQTDSIAEKVLQAGGEVALAKVKSNLKSVVGLGTKSKSRSTGELQFFDEKTGEVVRELHEENMITNAVDTILNPPDYIEIGMDSDNDRSFNMLRDFVGNIADTAFRGVIVCRDKIPEDGNNMMLPWTNEEIGHAGIANTNTDTSIGTYNSNESGRIENGKGYRHVWDFASDKANGEISCICLTTKDGGTNGMHHSYWNLSCGGTDLNSSSLDSFKQAYHTIVGRYIPDSQFNCGVFKWFYMGRLTNGNVRLLGKHIHDGCIYEVVMFDPMSISVSTEKPFCGIISVKKVIELFPAAERIPNSTYDNSYHHGSYFYDCNTTNADYVPQEEKEKLRQDWEDDPQWLAYFPYVIGDKIHIVATSRYHIHHYIGIHTTLTAGRYALMRLSVNWLTVRLRHIRRSRGISAAGTAVQGKAAAQIFSATLALKYARTG